MGNKCQYKRDLVAFFNYFFFVGAVDNLLSWNKRQKMQSRIDNRQTSQSKIVFSFLCLSVARISEYESEI